MAAVVARRRTQQMIDPALRRRLVARLGSDHPQVTAPMAERIIDQTLVFLKTCADNPDARLAPSALVDLGWHTFILHTQEYAAFCTSVAGRFIHHAPTVPGQGNGTSVAETVAVIRANGLPVDGGLWPGGAADCEFETKCTKNCHACQKGCHHSN